MKVEIRCPGCDKGYLVDESGGEFGCPACQTVLRWGAPTPVAAPAPVRAVAAASQAPAKPALPRSTIPLSGSANAATATARKISAPSEEAEDVVCPRCNLHFVPRQQTAAARSSSERATVLVVEDMPYFLAIAEDALSPTYEVRTAATSAEALAALGKGDVDLMVLDLTLDGGDQGIELLRGLAFKPCPILIFTAQDESEMYGAPWDELQTLGADDMVLKGMNAGESLLKKVGALLGKPWDEDD